MTAHGPYLFKYLPGEDVAGGGPGTPSAMSEFAARRDRATRRRVADRTVEAPLSDTADLRRQIWRSSSDRDLRGSRRPRLNDERSTTSSRFTTFYAIKGRNLVVPRLPSYDAIDVSYLGNIILEAAGLPLSEAQTRRRALMQACAGKYFELRAARRILAFHRRLIQSGLIRSPCTHDGAFRISKAQQAVEIVRTLGSYRWAGLYDVLPSEIAVIAWSGPQAPTYPRFPITQGLNGACVASRRAVIVQDVAADPRYLTTIGGTRGEMIQPVIDPSGVVVGTIDVESDRVNAFSSRDEELLAACAGICSGCGLRPAKQ